MNTKRISIIFVFFLLLAFSFPFSKSIILPASAETVSAGETVIELSSGRVLHEHQGNVKLAPASTTKILTAAIIIEDCDVTEKVKIPKECVGIEGSSVYLQEGDEYTVEDLLYGLMLRSGNDCAETLAWHHSKSSSAFAEVMNEKAKQWGAKNSHFTNPHGLPDDEHYTTAMDLALISGHAMQSDVFKKIVNTKYYARHNWANKNKMLTQYSGANGVKTGYTTKAGRCLVSAAERDGMQLISVVLNSPQMFERSAELLDTAFAEYSLQPVHTAEEIYTVNTDVKGKTVSARTANDFMYPLKANERIRKEVRLPNEIKLPVGKGENIGKIDYSLENKLIFSQNLCTINSVEKSYFDYLTDILKNF